MTHVHPYEYGLSICDMNGSWLIWIHTNGVWWRYKWFVTHMERYEWFVTHMDPYEWRLMAIWIGRDSYGSIWMVSLMAAWMGRDLCGSIYAIRESIHMDPYTNGDINGSWLIWSDSYGDMNLYGSIWISNGAMRGLFLMWTHKNGLWVR